MKHEFLFLLVLLKTAYAQTFTLPSNGNWYLVATMGGNHGHFEYIYNHATGNNPSIASGEIDFINAENFMFQHHTTMGYQAWNQPQFALINYGDTSQVWVKATIGVDADNFTVLNHLNATIRNGSTNISNLSSTGGIVTIYDKLKDNAATYYADVLIPSNSVAIGTSDTHGYKLAVNGTIRSKEIKVEASPWPDYVFTKHFQLRPLADVSSYIKTNHHLPDMPSAEDVKQNGINLGEANTLLLKKIEELTLYIINQNQEKINQQKEIDQFKQQLKAISLKVSKIR